MQFELRTQYCGVRTKEFKLRTEACVYFTIGLFILAGRSSAALEVNGKGEGRILNKGEGRILNKGKVNVAGAKRNIAEIELENLFINSISATVSRVG